MAKKGFDLAALAREAMDGAAAVSELDTVETVEASRIMTNDANFYEMSDLEELAASIELVGLLHPILVQPDGGDGGYILLDGERRFRAMTDVLGRKTVPCIIRRPVNSIVEELMLIEANRTQRKMTTSELSLQAERYTALLVQLKEAGVEIPGRLRDRVAEAMQVSASKLARLHAIRNNLTPKALELFDKNELQESAAYAMQQLPPAHQSFLAELGGMSEFEVRDLDGYLKKFEAASCEGSGCQHVRERMAFLKSQISWNRNCSGCCEYCYKLDSCKYACPKLADRAAELKAEAKKRKADQKAAEKAAEDRQRAEADADWARFKALRERQGVSLEDVAALDFRFHSAGSYEERSGAYPGWKVYDWLACYHESEYIHKLAQALGVTMEEVLGWDGPKVSRSDTPALVWHRVTEDDLPPEDGTVIFWGSKGLRTAVDDCRVRYCQMWPDEYRWWAIVEGPEEEENG